MPSVSPTTTVIDPSAILAAGKYQLFAYVHIEVLANFVNDVFFFTSSRSYHTDCRHCHRGSDLDCDCYYTSAN